MKSKRYDRRMPQWNAALRAYRDSQRARRMIEEGITDAPVAAKPDRGRPIQPHRSGGGVVTTNRLCINRAFIDEWSKLK